MTHGGFGDPGDPFGGSGDPFGGTPFGQYPGGQQPGGQFPGGQQPFGGPPIVSAPPPAPPNAPVNTFATLSLVFAFVFAPVGAVLGHLGLSQIKRTGQPGRNRALTGVILSYVVITVAVVALVVWAVIPGPAETPVAGPSSTAVSAPGTTSSPTPTTTPPPAAPVVTEAQFPGLLPSLDEVKAEVNPLSSTYGATDMTSWNSLPQDAFTPAGCMTAIAAGAVDMYENSGAITTLTRSINGLPVKTMIQLGAIDERITLYPDAASATAQATAIEQRWNGCVGQVDHLVGATQLTSKYQIDPVTRAAVDPSIAVLRGTTLDGPQLLVNTPIVRAVAAKNNVVVDVVVAFGADPGRDAETLAAKILSRIP